MEQIYEENSTLSPDISEEKFMIKDAVEHIAWKKSKLLNSILRGTVYGQLYDIVQNSSVSIKLECVTIQMKATEQYFHVVLFIMLYKMVLIFKSVDETLVCDHSNESYWAVLSCGTVYYAVQDGSNF